MAKKKHKNSFLFFRDWSILVNSLSDEDKLYFWSLYTQIDTDVVCDRDSVKPIWNFIISQINKINEDYENNTVKTNRENGALGGRPKKPKETEINPNNPMGKKEPKETLNRIEDNRIEDNKIKDVPAIEIFLSYALENKPKASKQDLELKYKAWVENNWKDGNNKPIKNWKSKLLSTLPYIKEVEPKGKLHFNSPIL